MIPNSILIIMGPFRFRAAFCYCAFLNCYAMIGSTTALVIPIYIFVILWDLLTQHGMVCQLCSRNSCSLDGCLRIMDGAMLPLQIDVGLGWISMFSIRSLLLMLVNVWKSAWMVSSISYRMISGNVLPSRLLCMKCPQGFRSPGISSI